MENNNDFAVFESYLRAKINISNDELYKIQQAASVRKLRKWQTILNDGDVWKRMSFITEGCCRLFRYDDKGVDHTVRFGIENWWMTDLESFNSNRPSLYNIEALANSTMLIWSKEDWITLQEEVPVFKQFYESLVSKAFETTQERVFTLISQNPEEKYFDFQRKYPHVFNKVPLHMVASYLGISRETLNRVRKELAKPKRTSE